MIYYNYKETDFILEQILFLEQPRHDYSYFDGMLYSNGGKTLVLSLCRGMHDDTVSIPLNVSRIEYKAFRDSRCSKVIFENEDVRISDVAFERSAWLDGCMKRKESIVIGNTLFRSYVEDSLDLDNDVCDFDKDCFSTCKPDKLSCLFPPPNYVMLDGQEESGSVKELTLKLCYGDIDWEDLSEWRDLKAVHLTDHKRYKDQDGVVFSKDCY